MQVREPGESILKNTLKRKEAHWMRSTLNIDIFSQGTMSFVVHAETELKQKAAILFDWEIICLNSQLPQQQEMETATPKKDETSKRAVTSMQIPLRFWDDPKHA